MAAQPTQTQSTHRIFMSFTSADEELAEYLTRELRRLLDNFNTVYCYTEPGTQDSLAGTRPADNFVKLIESRLKWCNVFIVLWSEAAKKSPWVLEELSHARHFLMLERRRNGQNFKIIPININQCSSHFYLSDIAYIRHNTGDDRQETLNKVLNALGRSAVHDDPKEVFVQGILFEVKTAFHNREWQTVVQNYPRLAKDHPDVVTAATHYRFAIALLMLEKTEHSLQAIREGLTLDNKQADASLLEQYINQLKGKRMWNELLSLAEQAIAKFPDDARWLQLKWDLDNRSNGGSSFFLPQSPHQMNLPKTTINLGALGANGAAIAEMDRQTAPFASLQQFPSLFQDTLMSSSHGAPTTQPVVEQLPGIDAYQAPGEDELQTTQHHQGEELLEEENFLPSESSSWQKANFLAKQHMIHHKLEILIQLSTVFIAILNVVFIVTTFVLLSLNTHFLIPTFFIILFVLSVGKLVEAEAVKVFCIIFILITWAAGGYGCGMRLYDYLSWGPSNSLETGIGMIAAIITAASGVYFHLRLFYSKRKVGE